MPRRRSDPDQEEPSRTTRHALPSALPGNTDGGNKPFFIIFWPHSPLLRMLMLVVYGALILGFYFAKAWVEAKGAKVASLPANTDTLDSTGLTHRSTLDSINEPRLTDLEIARLVDKYKTMEGDRGVDNAGWPGLAGFDPFVERYCPPEGSARSPTAQALNRLKNRMLLPKASDYDTRATLEALRAPGDDRTRWSSSRAATIEAYVRLVAATGAESCNCGATATNLADTLLELTSGPDDRALPVIAEITPILRSLHRHLRMEDWSSRAVYEKYAGKRIRVSGWLLFDETHLLEATNSDPRDAHGHQNWRATCWEIHPITRIEVIP